jgi:DDE superfamily endonuclease
MVDITNSNLMVKQYLLQLLDTSNAGDDKRPTSLLECIGEDGTMDTWKYLQYSSRESEMDDLLLKFQLDMVQSVGRSKTKLTRKKLRTKRKHKSNRPYYMDDTGKKIILRPRQTVWYLMYVENPTLDDEQFNQKFRRRFRMAHTTFKRLVERVKRDPLFMRWRPNVTDCFGSRASPIELLLLGALRYLGRGLTFDDLEEFTAIHEETHRQFFHKFIEFGSTTFYDKMVKFPTNAQEYEKSKHLYDIGGLTGAGFSTDATNVVMWRCSHNLRQANMGFKQSHPARTYNLTSDHSHRILHSTRGHPSRWNDKTLAHFDYFISSIHQGKILQDVIFHLYSWEGAVGSSRVETTKYNGAWGLVDNGYHRWSCTQAPSKRATQRTEQRLSEWIESFRKDTECTFGILKGRFRVLKTGIRLDGPEAADKVWLTCCAIHNFLLEEDGLDDWTGQLGMNDVADLQYAPFALQRLSGEEFALFGSRQHEREATQDAQKRKHWNIGSQNNREVGSESSHDNDNMEEEHDDEAGEIAHAPDGSIQVNSLTYKEFRSRLVEHFDILYRKHQVRWPCRQTHNK